MPKRTRTARSIKITKEERVPFMLIPGICLCFAPGITERDSVRYALRPTGFLHGANIRRNIFYGSNGAPLPGGGSAGVFAQSPAAKIDFFFQGHEIGERLASINEPGQTYGHMANGNFTGGSTNRHRDGRGRYFIASQAIVERVASAIGASSPLPSAGLGADAGDWLEVADGLRGSDSNYGAWFSNLNAVMRGSMNQAVIAYLLFPRSSGRRGI
jgi:hypothetical protein